MFPHTTNHMDVHSEEASGKALGIQMSSGPGGKEPSVCVGTGV